MGAGTTTGAGIIGATSTGTAGILDVGVIIEVFGSGIMMGVGAVTMGVFSTGVGAMPGATSIGMVTIGATSTGAGSTGVTGAGGIKFTVPS